MDAGRPRRRGTRRLRGRDEVSDGFGETWETWEVFDLEEHEARDLGDSILWLGRAQMEASPVTSSSTKSSRSTS